MEDLEKSVGCLLIKSPWVKVADWVSLDWYRDADAWEQGSAAPCGFSSPKA